MTGAFCYPIESLRHYSFGASFAKEGSLCERHGYSCTRIYAALACLRGGRIRHIPSIGSIVVVVDIHEARPDVIVGCRPCATVPSVQGTLRYDGKFWAHYYSPRPRARPLQSMALTCSVFHQYRCHVYSTTHNLPSICIEALDHRRWHGGSQINC